MIRTATREALVLLLLAIVFGFTYTSLTGRGLFAPSSTGPRGTAGLQMMTVADAQTAHADSTIIFVDSRHPFEFGRGHIPRAVNIPLNEFDARRAEIDQLRKTRGIVVYCDGAECNSSIELGARFLQLGFTDVHIFFGGWQEWRSRGLPVEGASS